MYNLLAYLIRDLDDDEVTEFFNRQMKSCTWKCINPDGVCDLEDKEANSELNAVQGKGEQTNIY